MRGKQSYLHSLSALQHRHTVSELSDEMKSLIIEKNKMGLEEDPELLVKGESDSQQTQFITPGPPVANKYVITLSSVILLKCNE